MEMTVNNKSLLPVFIVITTFILSPDFYNKLPDKYAHLLAALAVVLSTLMPSLFSSLEKEKDDKENNQAPIKTQ
jgi:hypothetical protein